MKHSLFPHLLWIWSLLLLVPFNNCLQAQQPDPNNRPNDTTTLSGAQLQKYLHSVAQKTSAVDQGIDGTNQKYLQKLSNIETRLLGKLKGADPSAGPAGSASPALAPAQYSQLSSTPATGTGTYLNAQGYNAKLDTLRTSLQFLTQGADGNKALAQTRLLQTHLAQSAAIQQYITQRQQELTTALSHYTHLPNGALQTLTQYKQSAYYYSQQISEYKQQLADPGKIESAVLTNLNKLPAFQQYMSTHSELATLFPKPAGYGTPAALNGLQAKSQIQQQLQQQASAGGGNGTQYMQQQMDAAQNALNQLKQKVANAGGNSSQMVIPDFVPNTQKTKTFLHRLVYGINLQSQKVDALLPVSTAIGVTVGYKLSDKCTVGIGADYAAGWGTDLEHIHLSNQGIGLRSYLDVKLKGSFWITGGYEENYQAGFSSIEQLRNLSAWQKSGLIGLTKTYKIGKQNANLQLLWDFLSYSQTPRTTPLLFRVGYTF